MTDLVAEANKTPVPSAFLPRAQAIAADLVDIVARAGFTTGTLQTTVDLLVSTYEAGKRHAATEAEIAKEQAAKAAAQGEAFAAKMTKAQGRK